MKNFGNQKEPKLQASINFIYAIADLHLWVARKEILFSESYQREIKNLTYLLHANKYLLYLSHIFYS